MGRLRGGAHRLTATALLRETVATSRSAPLALVTVFVLVLGVCLASFLVAGRAAANEQAVLGLIDDTGPRTVTVADLDGTSMLTGAAVQRIAGLSEVAWTVGVGPIADVRNTALGDAGQPRGLRTLIGGPGPALRLLGGRWPEAGEAVVSSAAQSGLGLGAPSGSIDTRTSSYDVVGAFAATAPLTDLDGVVLTGVADPTRAPVDRIYVVARDVAAVSELAVAIRGVVGAQSATGLSVTTSAELVSLQGAIGGELSAFSRQIALLVIAGGAVLVAVAMYAATAARRRDFGRRRAIGASRSALTLLVALQGTLPAVAGSVLGTLLGVVVVHRFSGAGPPVFFTLSVPALLIVSAVLATLPAALSAAGRDPVRVVRVP